MSDDARPLRREQFRYRIALHFNEELNIQDDKVREEISTCVRTGDYLWLAFDESTNIERLRWNGECYTSHHTFLLSDFFELTGDETDEVDLEGLAYHDHYLYLTGSMSTVRGKPDEDDDFETEADDLAQVERDVNRYLLGRIPCVRNEKTDAMELFREVAHPDDPDRMLRAAVLEHSDRDTRLTELLREDKHLSRYMEIPSKDNGFDVEGLAVDGERIFVGLRGPVLRGWAVILEIQVEEEGDRLKLKKIGRDGKYFRKHFVAMAGMGIRELSLQDDRGLLILAGPTMDLDGTISCWRIPHPLPENGVSFTHEPDRLFDITYGAQTAYGRDKAEGVAILPDGNLLIVYDEPLPERRIGDSGVYADVFAYPQRDD